VITSGASGSVVGRKRSTSSDGETRNFSEFQMIRPALPALSGVLVNSFVQGMLRPPVQPHPLEQGKSDSPRRRAVLLLSSWRNWLLGNPSTLNPWSS